MNDFKFGDFFLSEEYDEFIELSGDIVYSTRYRQLYYSNSGKIVNANDYLRNFKDYYIYKIKPGDTLIKIGNRFNIDYNELGKINRITDLNRIYAGDWLVIPKFKNRDYSYPKTVTDFVNKLSKVAKETSVSITPKEEKKEKEYKYVTTVKVLAFYGKDGTPYYLESGKYKWVEEETKNPCPIIPLDYILL